MKFYTLPQISKKTAGNPYGLGLIKNARGNPMTYQCVGHKIDQKKLVPTKTTRGPLGNKTHFFNQEVINKYNADYSK